MRIKLIEANLLIAEIKIEKVLDAVRGHKPGYLECDAKDILNRIERLKDNITRRR